MPVFIFESQSLAALPKIFYHFSLLPPVEESNCFPTSMWKSQYWILSILINFAGFQKHCFNIQFPDKQWKWAFFLSFFHQFTVQNLHAFSIFFKSFPFWSIGTSFTLQIFIFWLFKSVTNVLYQTVSYLLCVVFYIGLCVKTSYLQVRLMLNFQK